MRFLNESSEKIKKLQNYFGIPEICRYAIDPEEQDGRLVYLVSLSFSVAGIEEKDRDTADPELQVIKLGLPKEVNGIEVIYSFDEIKPLYWRSPLWNVLEAESVVRDDINVIVQEPIHTDNPHTLALRKSTSLIHGGLEIMRGTTVARWGATLGHIVWDAVTAQPYILSCSHVLCPERFQENQSGLWVPPQREGVPIFQPRRPRRIASLSRWGRPGISGAIDAAIAAIDPSIQYNHRYYGPSYGYVDRAPLVTPTLNQQAIMIGRTSGHISYGKYERTSVLNINFDYGLQSILTYEYYHFIGGTRSGSGDSGSPILSTDSPYNPIGINCASNSTYNYAVPAIAIEEELGVTFTPPEVIPGKQSKRSKLFITMGIGI